MGDYPSKQVHSSVEVTDQIFVAAIQEEILRDEIYCQIMKQLTENRNRYSPECKHPASAETGSNAGGEEEPQLLMAVGWWQRGKLAKCWRDAFPSSFSWAVLWGSPVHSTLDYRQATEHECHSSPLSCCFPPISIQCSPLSSMT